MDYDRQPLTFDGNHSTIDPTAEPDAEPDTDTGEAETGNLNSNDSAPNCTSVPSGNGQAARSIPRSWSKRSSVSAGKPHGCASKVAAAATAAAAAKAAGTPRGLPRSRWGHQGARPGATRSQASAETTDEPPAATVAPSPVRTAKRRTVTPQMAEAAVEEQVHGGDHWSARWR
eukprot:Skav223955  [mRNA]  locus=scaffold3540:70857:87363:+ [translate_table: standard]